MVYRYQLTHDNGSAEGSIEAESEDDARKKLTKQYKENKITDIVLKEEK